MLQSIEILLLKSQSLKLQYWLSLKAIPRTLLLKFHGFPLLCNTENMIENSSRLLILCWGLRGLPWAANQKEPQLVTPKPPCVFFTSLRYNLYLLVAYSILCYLFPLPKLWSREHVCFWTPRALGNEQALSKYWLNAWIEACRPAPLPEVKWKEHWD